MQNRLFLSLMMGALLIAPAVAAQDEKPEQKVKMQDLPAAVQATVKAETKGATLVGVTKEVENGKTMYELETKVNGRTRDLMIDEAGKVTSVEQEVTLESIPAPARDAIQRAVGKGKLLKVETLTEGGKTAYEAAIEVGKKKSEVKVDANGGLLK